MIGENYWQKLKSLKLIVISLQRRQGGIKQVAKLKLWESSGYDKNSFRQKQFAITLEMALNSSCNSCNVLYVDTTNQIRKWSLVDLTESEVDIN